MKICVHGCVHLMRRAHDVEFSKNFSNVYVNMKRRVNSKHSPTECYSSRSSIIFFPFFFIFFLCFCNCSCDMKNVDALFLLIYHNFFFFHFCFLSHDVTWMDPNAYRCRVWCGVLLSTYVCSLSFYHFYIWYDRKVFHFIYHY